MPQLTPCFHITTEKISYFYTNSDVKYTQFFLSFHSMLSFFAFPEIDLSRDISSIEISFNSNFFKLVKFYWKNICCGKKKVIFLICGVFDIFIVWAFFCFVKVSEKASVFQKYVWKDIKFSFHVYELWDTFFIDIYVHGKFRYFTQLIND